MIAIITCGHHPEDERIYGREIKSLISAGYNITYFTRWKGDGYLSKDNLWHRNYSKNELSIKEYVSGILNDFKVLKPKAVHIHEFELLPIAKTAKKLYGSKIIYDVHEANIELWDAFSSKPKVLKNIINKSLNKYENSYLKHVDYVLTTTPELVNRYEERGVKSYFIPNYPIEFPRKSKKSAIPTIIYHGQISFERGIEDLINAVAQLDVNQKPFKLMIYGSERNPGTIEQLNKLITKLKLNEFIELNDQISHEGILKVLSKAHIAVIPFRDYPMFQIAIPVKMFEAMWAKCAIIASDLQPLREYGNDFMEFYPPGNVDSLGRALRKVLLDDAERKRMGKIGADLIKNKYNWKKVEPTLFEVYKKVID